MLFLLRQPIRTNTLNGHDQHRHLSKFNYDPFIGLWVTKTENNLLVFNTSKSGVAGFAKNFPALRVLPGVYKDCVDTVRPNFQ